MKPRIVFGTFEESGGHYPYLEAHLGADVQTFLSDTGYANKEEAEKYMHLLIRLLKHKDAIVSKHEQD